MFQASLSPSQCSPLGVHLSFGPKECQQNDHCNNEWTDGLFKILNEASKKAFSKKVRRGKRRRRRRRKQKQDDENENGEEASRKSANEEV